MNKRTDAFACRFESYGFGLHMSFVAWRDGNADAVLFVGVWCTWNTRRVYCDFHIFGVVSVSPFPHLFSEQLCPTVFRAE